MRDGTTLRTLQRKFKKLEAKYEATPEKATLRRARIMRSAQAVERDIKKARALIEGLHKGNQEAH